MDIVAQDPQLGRFVWTLPEELASKVGQFSAQHQEFLTRSLGQLLLKYGATVLAALSLPEMTDSLEALNALTTEMDRFVIQLEQKHGLSGPPH